MLRSTTHVSSRASILGYSVSFCNCLVQFKEQRLVLLFCLVVICLWPRLALCNHRIISDYGWEGLNKASIRLSFAELVIVWIMIFVNFFKSIISPKNGALHCMFPAFILRTLPLPTLILSITQTSDLVICQSDLA